jgi:hypothetical protein
MHCGCISLGGINCDECHRDIPYPERYLVIHEGGTVTHLCINCSSDKGLVYYMEDKGTRTATFFPQKS